MEALATHGAQSTEDSDTWPQGPYDSGGGEADTPQHCDQCGVFLENPLTSDGDDYLLEATHPYESIIEPNNESWEDIAQKAESSGSPAIAQWIRFYLAPGQ
jgi:hypothetical protein